MLKYFRTARLVQKIKHTKIIRITNCNTVRGRLSENYLTLEIFLTRNICDLWYTVIRITLIGKTNCVYPKYNAHTRMYYNYRKYAKIDDYLHKIYVNEKNENYVRCLNKECTGGCHTVATYSPTACPSAPSGSSSKALSDCMIDHSHY